MNAPIYRATEVFDDTCGYTLQEIITAHELHGYIVSTPQYFICARPVIKGAPHELIVNPYFQFPLQQCNCWHVWIASANALPSLWTLVPHEFEWVSFQKLRSSSNDIRYIKFKRITNHGKRTKASNSSKTRRRRGTI